MDPAAAPVNARPASSVSRLRWLAALLVGALLWVGAVAVSHAGAPLLLDRPLTGTTFALVAALFAPLALAAVLTALRIAREPLRRAGFTRERARDDVVVGVAVAVVWALVQFLVLIPATGGAQRADVVVNAEQIGSTMPGLAAYLLLAWGGGFAEEVFFRGLLMTGLRRILGASGAATVAVVIVPTILFALVHGYQGGWVGMMDTGAFGGLTLSVLFLVRGRLLPCVVAHGLWNTIASIVIFLWSRT